MERNERPRRVMTRAAELFDLPADIVAGLCHLEMIGDRQLFLEGHGGILSYGTEQIDINAGPLLLRVRGEAEKTLFLSFQGELLVKLLKYRGDALCTLPK